MLNSNDPRSFLLQKLLVFKPQDAIEMQSYEQIVDFVKKDPNCFKKIDDFGHITGSLFIVDTLYKNTLLVHHKKLNEWLQPGGHSDGNPNTIEVAAREGLEETGLKSLCLASPNIFDLDAHMIPEYKGKPAHFHFDIRFLFTADINEPFTISHESNDIKWFSLKELVTTNKNKTIPRMAKKALEFGLKV